MDWKRWRLLLVALALLTVFSVKNRLLDPPSAPQTIAAGEFDHRRAIDRLARILGDQRPHPVDSDANDAVRGRLVAELRAIGLSPRIQEATDCSDFPKSRVVSCSHVRNVIAVLPGPAAPALLLNAHYDSTPTGPGAADDGIGVATMLEVAVIMKDRPRARPIVFLFNEGEEYGLNGAAAFIARDPLAKSVGALINMESRGVSGPASMFETDSPNGRGIADYAAAARRPYSNSLTSDLAKLIPNTTDVVKFKPAGWETLNFAIVGNETRYHSPGDRVEALSRDSLAHMGGEVLAATARLSGPDRPASGGQSVYADLAGLWFVHLPQGVAVAGVAALAIAALLACYRRRSWRALAGVAGYSLGVTLAVAAVTIALSSVRHGDFWRAHPAVLYAAIYATLLALLVAIVGRLAARHDRSQLRIAAWTQLILLGLLLSFFLPGASIFFLAGPALALAGIALAPRRAGLGRALFIIAALVQLVLFAELLAILEILLIDGPTAAVIPLALLAALPLLVEVARPAVPRAWVLPVALAAVLLIASLAMPRMSEERPGAFTLDYVRDDVRGRSNWAVATKQAPLPPAMNRFGPWEAKSLPYNGRTRWVADAPLFDPPRASLVRTSNVAAGKGRIATLRLATGGANSVMLRFDKDVPIIAMGLAGQRHAIDRKASGGPSVIRCTGRRCDRLVIEVEIGSRKPVEALLVAQRFGAPAEAAALLDAAPRPSHPQYAPHSQYRIRGYRL